MKLDFNNIDEVFKDGLEDYAEQPSGKVWKNISGKMFWHDLLHLRFGNISKIGLGTVAGIVVISVLLGLWFYTPGSDSTILTDSTVPTVSSETGHITDLEVQEITKIEIIDDISDANNPQQSNNSGISGLPMLENGSQQEILNQKTTQEVVTTSETATQVNNNPAFENTNKKSIEISETGTTGADADGSVLVTGSVGTVAADHILAPEAGINAEKNSAEMGSYELNTSQTPDQQTGENNEINSSGNLGQVEFVEPSLDSFIGISESLGNIQKIEQVGGISFTTAEPVNYSHRPAARSFATPPAFLNRGYVPYFSISAYIAPELTEYHRLASESREKSWLTGVSVSYNTEKYTFQAGLEYSRFDDVGDYLVNINSYDSIGFYEGISGFDIDPENPDELIYHTHTVEVWDTVQHHSHQQTTNNYSYLQIPVMFGYKAMESGIFSAHIKAGPNFSFLLNRDEPTLDYQSGAGTRITSVDNFTASRITTNVQVLVSVALRMQIAGRVGILVEPSYRYYLNTVYDLDDQSLKNPYGIGVRGGIFINL